MNKSPRVVTSCRGRFHIFDQARELEKQGLLHCLIADYPKGRAAAFDISVDKVQSRLLFGLFSHGFTKVRKWITPSLASRIDEFIHKSFSSTLRYFIPNGTDFFIGLSSFSLGALKYCRSRGIMCAVDHGSVHLEYDRQILQAEAKYWSVPLPRSRAAKWAIEKEDNEFRTADFVFVPSQFSKDTLVLNGIDPSKIFVNSIGVDINTFFPVVKVDEVFRIIQVGSVDLRKGVLRLIEAFQMINLPNSELIFVGAGRSNSEINGKLDSINDPRIKFLEPVPQNELRKYYNRSSIFVLASIADGFGMVVAQAMACGLPVIVTENVGAKGIVVDGINGFVVPARDSAVLADRIQVLYDNPSLRTEMGQKGLEKVRQNTWTDYGSRLSKFIQSQLSSHD